MKFFRKIWTEFMDFESTVGDLSSIKKVEKRVLATMTDSNGEANQAAQLIERYKVFDLWPCSKEELIIHGLSEHAPVEKSSGGLYYYFLFLIARSIQLICCCWTPFKNFA